MSTKPGPVHPNGEEEEIEIGLYRVSPVQRIDARRDEDPNVGVQLRSEYLPDPEVGRQRQRQPNAESSIESLISELGAGKGCEVAAGCPADRTRIERRTEEESALLFPLGLLLSR